MNSPNRNLFGIEYRICRIAGQIWREYAKQHGIKKEVCVKCGAKTDLHWHHPNYYEPLYTLCLCRKCHKKIHGGKRGNGAIHISDEDKLKLPTNYLSNFNKKSYEKLLRISPEKSSYGKDFKRYRQLYV